MVKLTTVMLVAALAATVSAMPTDIVTPVAKLAEAGTVQAPQVPLNNMMEHDMSVTVLPSMDHPATNLMAHMKDSPAASAPAASVSAPKSRREVPATTSTTPAPANMSPPMLTDAVDNDASKIKLRKRSPSTTTSTTTPATKTTATTSAPAVTPVVLPAGPPRAAPQLAISEVPAGTEDPTAIKMAKDVARRSISKTNTPPLANAIAATTNQTKTPISPATGIPLMPKTAESPIPKAMGSMAQITSPLPAAPLVPGQSTKPATAAGSMEAVITSVVAGQTTGQTTGSTAMSTGVQALPAPAAPVPTGIDQLVAKTKPLKI